MRGFEQVNALHVHVPFEQALRCFRGLTADPASLNGDGFDEAAALDVARASGSRSAQCIVRVVMGIVRYHFGSAAEASACLEAARGCSSTVSRRRGTCPCFTSTRRSPNEALPRARAARRCCGSLR